MITAQTLKPVARLVENAKTEQLDFKDVQGIIQTTSDSRSLSEIRNASDVTFFEYNVDYFQSEFAQNASKSISVNIPLNATTSFDVDLVEVDETFYDYQVRENSGAVRAATQTAKHYRGVVRGLETESLVSMSFFDEQMIGVVSINRVGNINIGKLRNSDLHIVYADSNLNSLPDYQCETPDDNQEGLPYTAEQLFESDSNRSEGKCVKLYFETEVDMFTQLGSVANVEAYVTGVFNNVATLYQNDGVTTEISEINVWSTIDPYTAGGTAALLSQFQANTGAFNGDLGQLLTFRGVGGGRAAGFAGLCNPNTDLSLSVSGNMSANYPDIPAYSFTIHVVAHEFGHLFGSRHTHACVWNGNNTAIDGCAGGTEGSCALPPIPPGGGTIMSYCHIQSVGIDFNLGFGPQPGNLIRNNVCDAQCIEVCCEDAEEVVITADGIDISDTLVYTIPCGETCFTLNATNVENAVYNTTDPILNDLEGLFCIGSFTGVSFTAFIEGQDSCGEDYYQEITVYIAQNCDNPGDCEDFNSSVGNWQTSAAGNSISTIGPTADGTPYMRGTDGASSSGSWIYNESDYTGDLGDAGGTCFCWDYKVFDDSVAGASPAMNPRIRIYSGTVTSQTAWATFVATNISITENDGWVRVCAAPILPTTGAFPANADGNWVMPGGSTAADWNNLIANIDGITFHTDVAGSSTQNEVIGVDNFCAAVCCDDEPYIEPFWELCDSNNVCELEDWPVHVLDDDGTPLLLIDGYTFVWSDGSTSDVLYGVVAWQNYSVVVTYPDGCEYEIFYYKECCEDDITVIFDECPEAEMLPILQRELEEFDERSSVVSKPDLESAIESYSQEEDRARDCDPCVGGIVIITIVDLDGNPITNFVSITITDNSTGVTIDTGGNVTFSVYVNISYTVTVVTVDADGNECIYTHDFIYICEDEPCETNQPINLVLTGSTLTWDPVPDAIGYVVINAPFWPQDCRCDFPISILDIETSVPSVVLPTSPGRCFVVQVVAICADGSRSEPSDAICIGGDRIEDKDNPKSFEQVSISPNPTTGFMTFIVETAYETDVTIEVYNIYGTVLRTFNENISSNRATTIDYDGSGLSKGVYIVKFKTDVETLYKRVIIK